MVIEEELINFLERTVEESSTKNRDILLVLNHFGFGAMFWPTLEEIGAPYGVNTRERARQIVRDTYTANVGKQRFVALETAVRMLTTRPFWYESEYLAVLEDLGISGRLRSFPTLLRYMRSQGYAADYELYLPDMTRLTGDRGFRSLYFNHDERAIVRKDLVKPLQHALGVASGLPGQLGLAEISYIRDKAPEADLDLVKALIRINKHTFHAEIDGGYWYTFENFENVLVNNSGKIFGLADAVDADLLAVVLENSLKRRGSDVPYPSVAAIRAYLGKSVFFEVKDGMATFKGETRELTDIEAAVVAFFKDRETTSNEEIVPHLKSLGFSGPAIHKAVYANALVFIDRSPGRGYFKFHLATNVPGYAKALASAPPSLQEMFSERLRRIEVNGTDFTMEVAARREQPILREWLFEGADTSECAICQRPFSTRSLVAAHKKKRKYCSEVERLDLNIVFPLCVFGCDHLYEQGYIRIKDGVVVRNDDKAVNTAENQVVDQLVGKRLAARWTRGPAEYFDNGR